MDEQGKRNYDKRLKKGGGTGRRRSVKEVEDKHRFILKKKKKSSEGGDEKWVSLKGTKEKRESCNWPLKCHDFRWG